MKRRWITIAVGLAIAAVALAALACNDNGSSSKATKTAPKQTAARTAASTPASTASSQTTPSASGATVVVAQNATLGKIATDSAGKTLYKFANDAPNTSNCAAGCTSLWPPLTISGGTPTAGPGVTGTLGTIERSDGTTQVTLDGAPLYTFANDTAPGDAKGDGFANLWSAIKFT